MAFAFWRSLLDPNLPGDMSAHEVSDSVAFPDLYEAGTAELQQGLEKGQFTSADLVKVGPPPGVCDFPVSCAFSRHTLHELRQLI